MPSPHPCPASQSAQKMHLEHFPKLDRKVAVFQRVLTNNKTLRLTYFPSLWELLLASACLSAEQNWVSVLCMDVCMHTRKNIRMWTGACGLSKPLSLSAVVANSKCLPQNILPASSSMWLRDCLSQRLCLCVLAFNKTSQQVSLPYACLYSYVLPDISNDFFWLQPTHHRPSALHWSLVKKHLSLAWLWITPTWSMGWCTNTSAVLESNHLSWRKLWNQKVASI